MLVLSLSLFFPQILNCLTQDKELPVKVEAAVGLQHLIKNQTLAEKVIQPYVKVIIQGNMSVVVTN